VLCWWSSSWRRARSPWPGCSAGACNSTDRGNRGLRGSCRPIARPTPSRRTARRSLRQPAPWRISWRRLSRRPRPTARMCRPSSRRRRHRRPVFPTGPGFADRCAMATTRNGPSAPTGPSPASRRCGSSPSAVATPRSPSPTAGYSRSSNDGHRRSWLPTTRRPDANCGRTAGTRTSRSGWAATDRARRPRGRARRRG